MEHRARSVNYHHDASFPPDAPGLRLSYFYKQRLVQTRSKPSAPCPKQFYLYDTNSELKQSVPHRRN